eukprot:scaffold1498_cov129-Isochrysis_galbana.AAC.3
MASAQRAPLPRNLRPQTSDSDATETKTQTDIHTKIDLQTLRCTAECAACDGSCCRHSHALPSAASVAWLLANFA